MNHPEMILIVIVSKLLRSKQPKNQKIIPSHKTVTPNYNLSIANLKRRKALRRKTKRRLKVRRIKKRRAKARVKRRSRKRTNLSRSRKR